MHSPGGDHGLEHEDTEAEHEQATPYPLGASQPSASSSSDARASASSSREAGGDGGEAGDELARERRKEEQARSQDGPSASSQQQNESAVSASGTAARQEARENEETRTPSSCSENQLEQASSCEDKECDDAAEGSHKHGLVRAKPVAVRSMSSCEESPGASGTDACEGGDEIGLSPQRLAEGAPGAPPAALVPHLSMPGLRGPRPAPALGGKFAAVPQDPLRQQQQAGPARQHQGPLGDLMTWLNDAEVGDVLDQSILNDLLQTQHGQGQGPERAHYLGRSLPTSLLASPAMLASERAAAYRSIDAPVQSDEDMDEDAEDEFEEVPSDKECLPRAPPLAPSSAPLMRPLTPEHSPRDNPDKQIIGGYCAIPGSPPNEGHNEEEEWLARQRLTGAIGRLVRYNEGEITPKDDILGLRCTRRGRIMVTAVHENGIAMKAGVAAGDELVSIDGRKEFVGHPAHVVHASLRAPVTLVFLGFVGKLQAEVRVKRPPEPKCGLAPGTDIVVHGVEKSHSSAKLCDAVVFKQGDLTSLLITAGADEQARAEELQQPTTASLDQTVELGPPVPATASKTVMYELQREDARNLVVNALGTTAAL